MVHHDRLRRFEQDVTQPVPLWVREAIASFERRKTTAVQTDVADVDGTEVEWPPPLATCTVCKQIGQDEYGLHRTLSQLNVCQLCK